MIRKKLSTFIACCFMLTSVFAQEPVSEFMSTYTGTSSWNQTSGTLTISGSGELRFTQKGLSDFIWSVPETVKKIYIKANVTVDAAFHVNNNITIQGEDRNTSVIFGTDTQAWPLVSGLEGKEQNYAQIQAEEKKWKYFELFVDNLTIKNARSYAVRCWDRPAHMSNCNVIDDRGGWKNHSDGFEGGHFSTITNCYFETGDDVIKCYKDLTVKNCTIKMILNAVPFQFGWGSYGFCRADIENVTVIGHSGRGEWEGSTPIFQWSGGNDKRTVVMKNCHFDAPNASLFDLNPSGGGLDLEITNSYINVRQYAYQLNAWGTRKICGETEPKTKNFWDDTEAPFITITSEFVNASVVADSGFTVTASAVDNETSVDSMILIFNGVRLKALKGSSLEHTINNVPPGIHTVRIEATDTEGNKTYRYFKLVGKCTDSCDNVNLLENGDMEDGKDPWIENVSGLWGKTGAAYQGQGMLEVNRMYNGYGNQGIKQIITKQLLAHGPGKYRISAMVKQVSGTPIDVHASVFIKRDPRPTPQGDPDPNFKTPSVTLSTTEWREVSGIVDISWPRMYYAWFTVVSSTAELVNDANFYVDNCVLQPIEPGSYPSAEITAPMNGSSITVGNAVEFNATAQYEKGTIASVKLLLNGTLIKTFPGEPYTHTFSNLAAGSHTISVLVTTNDEKTITATSTVKVNPIISAYQTFQAVSYHGSSGIIKDEFCRAHVGQINGGDWIMFNNLDFGGTNAVCKVSAAAGYDRPGSKIEIRLGSPTGTKAGEIAIPSTGDWCTYQVFQSNIHISGVHNVYAVFVGGDDIFDLEWIRFEASTPNALNSTANNFFKVYPNPATNHIFILCNTPSDNATVEVLSITGKRLWEQHLTGTTTTISVAEIGEKGMVLLKITSNEQTNYQKIIIE
jgi:hypothetical protein